MAKGRGCGNRQVLLHSRTRREKKGEEGGGANAGAGAREGERER